jgi:hypothetical protein
MSVGLDLGFRQFRSLRRQGDRLIARSCPPVYAVVLDNPARRALFLERGVPFAQFGMNLILFGDAAVEWSEQLRVSAIPLCVQGRLLIDDAVIRQVATALIEGLLPPPIDGYTDCCLTLPGGLHRNGAAAETWLSQVIRQFGHQPQLTSGSLAVALAELSPWGLTGLGISLGETHSELSIVRHGRELAHLEIPFGISAPVMTPGLDEPLRELFATMAFELTRRPEWKALPMPVSVAIAGEAVADSTIAERVSAGLQHASWPFALGAIQVPTDACWTVARGCVIQAELEQLTAAARSAA